MTIPHSSSLPPGENEAEVASPCTNVCKLDARGFCLGCGRSMDEIANWPQSRNAEKLIILERIRRRQMEKTS